MMIGRKHYAFGQSSLTKAYKEVPHGVSPNSLYG